MKDRSSPFSRLERLGLVSTLRRYSHLQMEVLKISGLRVEDGESRATIRDLGLLKGAPAAYEFEGHTEEANVLSKLSHGGFDFRCEHFWWSLQLISARAMGYPMDVKLFTTETAVDLRDKPSPGWKALRFAVACMNADLSAYRKSALAPAHAYRKRIQDGNAQFLDQHSRLQ